MNRFALTTAVLTVNTLLATAAPASPIVIYREIFPNYKTSDTTLDQAQTGWEVYRQRLGQANVGERITHFTSTPAISGGVGSSHVNNEPAVNSNPQYTPSGGNRGWLWNNATIFDPVFLHWTDEYTIDRSRWAIDTFSVAVRHTSTSDPDHIAVRIGEQWYSSDQQRFSQGSDSSWPATSTWDFSEMTWNLLDFAPTFSTRWDDSPTLALTGTPATLPGGDITAFGVLNSNRTNTLRYDTFEIRAEPVEPHAVLYREIFPNDTTDNIYSSVAKPETGWAVHIGASGVEQPVTNDNTTWHISFNPVDVGPTADIPVNSNPQRVPLENRGYLWQGTGPSGAPQILWTDEYTVDRRDVTEITWWQQNSDDSPIRVALEIGGDWFASSEDFGGAGTLVRSLDFGAAEWRSLAFEPNVSLALGGPTTLPLGDITAFGWFTESRTHTLRLDSFEIRGVPEPGTLMLLAAGALALLWRRRRAAC